MARNLWAATLLGLVIGMPAQGQSPEAPADGKPFLLSEGCDPCCNPVCGPPGRTWFRADYLMYWIRETELPPLITASPPGTPLDNAGVIGTPGTTVIAGGDSAGGDLRSGGRFTLGHWLNCEQTIGVEIGFFMLENRGDPFGAGSADGSQILGRPFINANTGQNDAELVSFPGVLAGSAFGSFNSSLLGANADLRKNLCCGCCYRIDALVGYRFLRYDEGLQINEQLFPDAPAAAGTRIDLYDRFNTENEFHGLNLGLVGETRRGKWFVEGRGQVALGCLERRVCIDGGTLVTVPGAAPVFNQGGLLALSSNIGQYSSTQFSAVPEIGLAVGYQVTEHLRLRLGYSMLWIPEVARAADQIDLVVNPNLIPPVTPPVAGPQRPAFDLDESNIWVQGLALGFELRY